LFYVATGRVVTAVFEAVSGSGDAAVAYRWLAVSGALFVVQQVLGPLRQLATADLGYRLEQAVRNRIMAASLEPSGVAHLEDPVVNDQIAQARAVATGQVSPLVAIISFFTLATRYLAATGAAILLATWKWWLGLLLALAYIGIGRVSRRVFRAVLDAAFGAVPALRRSDYYRDLALRPEAAKEMRVFGLGGWILDRFSTSWTGAMADIWRSRVGGRSRVIAAVGVQTAVKFAAFAYLAWLAVRGEVGPGLMATLAQAMNGVPQFGALGQEDLLLAQGSTAIPAALTLPEAVAATQLPAADEPHDPNGLPRHSIRFEAVQFAYPRAEARIYDSLDLEIRAGESLAIVGVNGAGKTTLVKLLARLYDPIGGRITVDGIDLRDLDAVRWQRQVAAIFQDFVRYHLPARENVGLGALHLMNDESALDRAAARAGAAGVIESLPEGWDTTLSRELTDGAELSGGQWQRIALARALLAVDGGARVLVLDEPTANLDVRAEAELYDRFLDLTSGLTSIIISHRFSTVRRANRIVVLEGGRVIEDGNHDSLMAAGGRYATMFRLQAARFADAPSGAGEGDEAVT
jgi:ATP-binding cassette subfamily B protein